MRHCCKKQHICNHYLTAANATLKSFLHICHFLVQRDPSAEFCADKVYDAAECQLEVLIWSLLQYKQLSPASAINHNHNIETKYWFGCQFYRYASRYTVVLAAMMYQHFQCHCTDQLDWHLSRKDMCYCSVLTTSDSVMTTNQHTLDIDLKIQLACMTLTFDTFLPENRTVSYMCNGEYFLQIWSLDEFQFWTHGPKWNGRTDRQRDRDRQMDSVIPTYGPIQAAV